MTDFGFSSVYSSFNPNKNNGFNTSIASQLGGLITPVRVINILLDDSDPVIFNSLGGWNAIGAIQYELVENPLVFNENNIAFPINPNNKNFPLINEIVYIITLPNTAIGESNVSKRSYYINNIGLWNHPHHNAYPTLPNNLPPSQRKDYEQTTLGSVRRVTDNSTEINLGKTFKERANIHPLLPFEGDIIHEGRWGNSIRLGSTVKNTFRNNNWSSNGNDGDPIVIIRSGQGNQTKEGWLPITEDINNDESSIYLASTQKVPLNASSIDYTSYTTPPTTPNQYAGAQIILNSGRLVFNSWNDHILLSSAKSINLNSQESVNIDTKKFITQADKIFLGKEDLATEPLLLGNTTAQLLRNLTSSVKELANALQLLKSAPVAPNSPATFPSLLIPTTKVLGTLQALEKQLGTSSENCTITSKRNFTL